MAKIFLCDEKKWVDESPEYVRCVTYFDGKYLEFGYCKANLKHKIIQIEGSLYIWLSDEKSPYPYNKTIGCYTTKRPSHVSPRNQFCYGTPEVYNLSKVPKYSYKVIPTFKENQVFKDLFPFTYGFEFETCDGHIESTKCYDLSLIPVFDGSITGYEYVTTVLPSEQVIDAINNCTQALKENTKYDRNCSIHMHIGGFPIDVIAIKVLLDYWYKFQYIIAEYLPRDIYHTERWKESHKSYCLEYPQVSLIKFYHQYTDNTLRGNESLYWENSYDENEDHKWTVNGRYFNMNIMHLISGQNAKTIEFRFIHPTHNPRLIELWVIILSAFVKWVMMHYQDTVKPEISLFKVLSDVLPDNMVQVIINKLQLLKWNKKWQESRQDFAGLDEGYLNMLPKIEIFNKEICVE